VFATTFLGHQGWLIRGLKSALLIDPLLVEDFGAAQMLAYRVFPPRVWTPAAMPKLDAVILSHEHDDHFDIPSLAKLDRAIPIYLSSRSSSAARTILGEMGFTLHALAPGVPIKFRDLEVTPFAGDHVQTGTGDEWDTLPFLVRSLEGHGSFFSMVDIPITQQHVEWAAARSMRPGVVSWTNNAMDWSHMASYLSERVEGTQKCLVDMGVGHKLITQHWGVPAAMVMCAGGFSFHDELAWLNQRVFCVDTDAVCAQMAKLYKNEKFMSGVPGQTFVMVANKLKAIEVAPFLTTTPRETWPSRAKASTDVPDYAPATHRELSSDEAAALPAALDAFAASLVGGLTFRSLCSLLDSECGGKRPTFALVLRDGERRQVLAYEPTACRFVPVERSGFAGPRSAPEGERGVSIDDGKPEDVFIAGIECWAADFAAVLAGRLGPIAITFNRARLWSHVARLRFDIFPDLYRVSHPLRRPAEYLATYRRLWEAAKSTEPVFGAAHQ
jgi:Beta-lactamase superfamily domain